MLWFRLNTESLRVPWQSGSENLKVDRANLVMSSKVGLRKLNLHKELKITFDDEVVQDAGGLLREWMHMFVKEVFAPETAIFAPCATDETAYKFVWDKQLDEEFALENLSALGVIIGKALFERVSLNCYLNRSILRQLCHQNVMLCDVYSFDKEVLGPQRRCTVRGRAYWTAVGRRSCS
jgi:E3 ubiquitin-protein ligase HUWE1